MGQAVLPEQLDAILGLLVVAQSLLSILAGPGGLQSRLNLSDGVAVDGGLV